MKQKKIMYSVQTAPTSADFYHECSVARVCYTSSKIWANIRFFFACWKLKKGRSCWIVICRPSEGGSQ